MDMRDSKQWGRAKELFATYGLWAVLLLAAIPNPLFDALGIIAGSFAYPVRRFWVACLIGKVIKFTAMAYLADSAVGWWYAR